MELNKADTLETARNDYIKTGISAYHLALKYPLYTKDTYYKHINDKKSGWKPLREQYVRDHPPDATDWKDQVRAVMWAVVQRKVFDQILLMEEKDLDVNRLDILTKILDRGIKGERLENGQPILLEKRTLSLGDSNEKPPQLLYEVTEENDKTPLLPDEGSTE